MAAGRTSHTLNHQELAAIECPLQQQQYARLVDRLGGERRLSSLLSTKDPNRPVELQLIQSTSNNFIRPVAGEFVNTSNILIKVIKRSRKTTPSSSSTSQSQTDSQLYKIEPVGVIPLTVRFRTLADYHYTPDLKHPINTLARDIRSLNEEGVLKFRFEPETEDYSSSSKIGLFPPPLFSRYLVPQLYNYRQSIPSVITDTPEGHQRLVNKSKYVPLAPQSITFDHPQVPQGPLPSNLCQKKTSDEPVYQRIEALFEERPMWIRLAFQNQLSLRHVRLLRQNREILALSCYTFLDGPFKDFLIKFKYDPRVHSEARLFQRISLRNLDKTDASEKFTFKLMKRPVQRGAHSGEIDSTTRRDHIFDGQELHQSVGTYQLCDITDPLLKSLINSTKGVLNQCHVRTGWYTLNAIEQIRSILRKKFHALLNGQRVLKDIECVDLLDIDISLDAIDLVKKSSVTEKRGINKFYTTGTGTGTSTSTSTTPINTDKDKEKDGAEVDLDNDSSPHSPKKTSASSSGKPLHPNPLLKYRREKNRIKAKPADKSVTFLDLDGDLEMVAENDDQDDRTRNENTPHNNSRATSTSTSSASNIAIKANQIIERREDDDDDDDSEDDEDDDEDQEEEEEEMEEFDENENENENDNIEVDQDVHDRESSDLSDLPDSDGQ